jgi:hypothetical protein
MQDSAFGDGRLSAIDRKTTQAGKMGHDATIAL